MDNQYFNQENIISDDNNENVKQQIAFTEDVIEAENNLMDTQNKIQCFKKDQQYRCKQIKKQSSFKV